MWLLGPYCRVWYKLDVNTASQVWGEHSGSRPGKQQTMLPARGRSSSGGLHPARALETQTKENTERSEPWEAAA